MAAITTSRRLISRDPSCLRIFIAATGMAGDVAAIFKFTELVWALMAGQLLLALLSAAEATDVDIEAVLTSLGFEAPNAPATASQ